MCLERVDQSGFAGKSGRAVGRSVDFFGMYSDADCDLHDRQVTSSTASWASQYRFMREGQRHLRTDSSVVPCMFQSCPSCSWIETSFWEYGHSDGVMLVSQSDKAKTMKTVSTEQSLQQVQREQ